MGTERLVCRRRPGIAWREEEAAAREVLAALDEGRECSQEGTLILVDAGRVFELNLLGAEIWKLCDGNHGVGEIAEKLLGRFEVSREELERDVREFLEEMLEKDWVVRE